ncbi:hypothetical protein [Phormidium nigroviride]
MLIQQNTNLILGITSFVTIPLLKGDTAHSNRAQLYKASSIGIEIRTYAYSTTALWAAIALTKEQS